MQSRARIWANGTPLPAARSLADAAPHPYAYAYATLARSNPTVSHALRILLQWSFGPLSSVG